MTGNTNLDSIILEIRNDQKTVEDLKIFLKENEVIISTQIFKYALKCSQAVKEAVIHEILLHFVKNSNKQSLKDVIEHLDEAIKNRTSIGRYKELDTLLNFQDNKGNTLLHYVALYNRHKDAKTLIKYDINTLIQNTDKQIPLNLAKGQVRETLIEGMMKQASSKKASSRCEALKCVFGTSFLAFTVFGLCVCIAAERDVVSFPSAMLGVTIASPLVGIVVGLITYFLDQERKEAKAIETQLILPQVSEVSEKSPLLQPSMQ